LLSAAAPFNPNEKDKNYANLIRNISKSSSRCNANLFDNADVGVNVDSKTSVINSECKTQLNYHQSSKKFNGNGNSNGNDDNDDNHYNMADLKEVLIDKLKKVLIDKLKKQKEITASLLQKSKEKHNELLFAKKYENVV
jgi:hypothetical protein